MEYREINCKNACNRNNKKFLPYKWDLNIYRGCSHQCNYCYALYSHKYLGSTDFFNEIYAKSNIIEKLGEKLSKSSWKKEIIAIGTVSDSYQLIEEKLKIMPKILDLFIKYKNPAIISTKSDLVIRDLDLIKKLSEVTYVNIAGSITTCDEYLKSTIEPNTKPIKNRIAMLKEIKEKTDASVAIHGTVVPYITDSYENLEAIFKAGNYVDIDYILVNPINLYGKTRNHFFKFVKENFPEKEKNIKLLYKTGKINKEYTKTLYKKVSELKRKYGISSNYMKKINEKLPKNNKNSKFGNYKQSTLFEYD